MLNADRFDSAISLTHEQAEQTKKRTADFERGYQRGWWHQPEQDPQNEEYMKGWRKGWDDKTMDMR